MASRLTKTPTARVSKHPRKLSKIEQKVVETADDYEATTASDWTSLGSGTNSEPTDQDDALDILASEALGDAKVEQSMLNKTVVTEDFESTPIGQMSNGANGVGVVTTGAVNGFFTRENSFESIVLGAGATLTDFGWLSGSGIAFSKDQTDNMGVEITQGVTAALNPTVKVVGTDNCRFTCKWNVATAAGSDFLMVGWRKVQAYQTSLAAYTDYAGVNLDTTDLVLASENDGSADSDVDTTQDAVDTQNVEVRVTVGDEAYLQTSFDLANAYKATWNTHCADATEHATAADAVNTISSADATTLATLFTLVEEMLIDYVAHDADVVLTTPAYHKATSTANALASVVVPASLSDCVSRLNDLKAKYNLHEANTTSHHVGSAGTETQPNACNTYFELALNNAALAVPTVTKVFDFDDTDSIIPFFFFLHNGSLTGAASFIHSWKVEDLTTTTS